jgi:hypothetical protein
VPTVESIGELAARYVSPFYLHMMRINAVKYGPALVVDVDIAAAGADLTASSVVRLLGLAWRERVMGARYGVRVGGPDVTDAVLRALRTSQGSPDAPPLATAATILAGPAAIDGLEHYFDADQAGDWGPVD